MSQNTPRPKHSSGATVAYAAGVTTVVAIEITGLVGLARLPWNEVIAAPWGAIVEGDRAALAPLQPILGRALGLAGCMVVGGLLWQTWRDRRVESSPRRAVRGEVPQDVKAAAPAPRDLSDVTRRLADADVAERLGGLKTLEDHARARPDMDDTILGLFAAFVRMHATPDNEQVLSADVQVLPPIAPDVYTAVRALARRGQTTARKELLDLRGVDLRGLRLTDADLAGSLLSGAWLQGSSLGGIDLEHVLLDGVHLDGADLTGANLRGAKLGNAHLVNANLTGADLRNAYLPGADLRGAILRRADLSEAYLQDANLQGAILDRATLQATYLAGADVSGASLMDVDLTGAYIRSAVGMVQPIREGEDVMTDNVIPLVR